METPNKDYENAQETKRESYNNITLPKNTTRKSPASLQEQGISNIQKPKDDLSFLIHKTSNLYHLGQCYSQTFNKSEFPMFDNIDFNIHIDENYKKLYKNLYADFLSMQKLYRKSLDEIRKYKFEFKIFKDKNEKLEEMNKKLEQIIKGNNYKENSPKNISSLKLKNESQELKSETKKIEERNEIIRIQFEIIDKKNDEISKLQTEICNMKEQFKKLEIERQDSYINEVLVHDEALKKMNSQ